jgi:hypothetical protein
VLPRLFFRALLLGLFCLAPSWADGLKGKVTDPSGAVVTGAHVTIQSQATPGARTLTTDSAGAFSAEGLEPGTYTVAVEAPGFDKFEQTVNIPATGGITIAIALKIAAEETAVEVTAKRSALANADPNYRALRAATIQETFRVENVVLKRDNGVLTLRSGVVSFARPVLGRVVMAVFRGDGQFTFTPVLDIERDYLVKIAEQKVVEESFDNALFAFTDATYEEIRKQGQPAADESAAGLLENYRRQLRHRTETPRSLVEALISGDTVSNLDAQLLAELYNPAGAGSFSAYLHGKKHSSLRFLIRPRGALPDLSPEEVALINLDPEGRQEGIWYLSHYLTEWTQHTAASTEDKRIIAADRYKIETVLGRRDRLAATADIQFRSLRDGDRVIDFDLLPNLRVSRVTYQDKEIGFIQEDRKHDGSFYVILPEATAKDRSYRILAEYDGNNVVHNAGSGNFSVGARESWYPSTGAFRDRAAFDLIFRVPKQYLLVSVGKLVKEWREDNFAVTEWQSDLPLAVAGFNYGSYKKKQVHDDTTKYDVEAYATSELPDYLRNASQFGSMTPSALAQNAMVDAENAVRCFTAWFGDLPYGRLAITQQPEFSFGQSWPTLIYLPISAFLDSTQRWSLLGGNTFKFAEFIQEVTPHEVAHQWWGHAVGWSSYHDQWLSEGFADFSAGLFLQQMERNQDKYQKYWENARKMILEKNEFGNRANDAGPIWMGLRLNTFKTASAYRRMIYPKGGYILHMLRYLMQDEKGDQNFIDTMHDYVKTYANRAASTESFMNLVEKHMTRNLNLENNGSMGWFFREWVYGTEIPSYNLQYALTSAEGGKFLLTGKISQSDVSGTFKMRAQVYADFDGKLVRLGSVGLLGSQTGPEFKILLPRKPKRILLNANHDVLASSTTVEQM